jgi:hypothetical protein
MRCQRPATAGPRDLVSAPTAPVTNRVFITPPTAGLPGLSANRRTWPDTVGSVGSAHCADGFGELAVVERVVHAAARQQFRMIAMFHDAPAVHDDNRVGVSYR